MKILALVVLLGIAVAAPSFAQKLDHAGKIKIGRPDQPRQPYRGGGRRELYPIPY